MSLHRLTSITVGVPNVEETAAYYADFGLRPTGTSPDGAVRFATRDGGEQLEIVPASRRKLVRIGIGIEDADDLIACLNWALHHEREITPDDLEMWRMTRAGHDTIG